MEIIALQGRGNCGKSYTINSLYQHLLLNGYTQVPGHFQDLKGHYDFLDVLTLNGRSFIGIVSRGDIGAWLATDLQTLNAAGCFKTICTCRTSGGTVSVILPYSPHRFVRKTMAVIQSDERIENHRDMLTLYALI